jgi:hypothetical protein
MAEDAGELAALRELAERLLMMRGLFAVADSPPQLIAGRLPDGLPLHLPLPAGARVVGAVRRQAPPLPGRAAGGEMTEIVLDAPGSADDVLRFYERELPALGWPVREAGEPPRPGGFVPFAVLPSRTFGQETGGQQLSLRVAPLAGGNDVRIQLGPAGVGPRGVPPQRPPGFGILPSLTPPPGVPLVPLGGGGGPAMMSSTALAQSDQSASALEAHFGQHFEAGGWTRTDVGASGPLAWSRWSSTAHEDWAGLLLVVEEPTPNQRLLHARVSPEGTNLPQPAAGWVGSAGMSLWYRP